MFQELFSFLFNTIYYFWSKINPLTPKISLEILLTVCHIALVMLVLRIWYWIN